MNHSTPRMIMLRILVLLFSISFSACATSNKEAFTPHPEEPQKTIYLVSHGWHSGIVLQRSDLPSHGWPELKYFSEADYLEIGWGDKQYYQTPSPNLGIILKATMLPTPKCLTHCWLQ